MKTQNQKKQQRQIYAAFDHSHENSKYPCLNQLLLMEDLSVLAMKTQGNEQEDQSIDNSDIGGRGSLLQGDRKQSKGTEKVFPVWCYTDSQPDQQDKHQQVKDTAKLESKHC